MAPHEELAEKHATNPEVGDYWHDHLMPVCFVLEVTDTTVRTCTERKIHSDSWEWDLEQQLLQTRDEFKASLAYGSIPGYYARVSPGRMIEDAKEADLTITPKFSPTILGRDENLEKLLVELITGFQGCKATELIVRVVSKDHKIPGEKILSTLERLVKDQKIIEVEYVLPDMDYRCKSLYFPLGTTFTIRKPNLISGC